MQFMQKVLTVFKALWRRFLAFGARVGWKRLGVGAAGIVLGLLGARTLFGHSAGTVIESSVPQVTVSSVADLSNQSSPLSLVGTVQSTAQATVLAESSGAVTAVYRSLGDHVAAGSVLATLENSSQQAAVLQAQGGVDAAQVALNKIGVGTESAKSGALNALLSAYSSVDSAIRGTADPMFTNPTGDSPQFTVNSTNSQLVVSLNYTRPSLTALWNRETARAGSLAHTDDLATELSTTIGEVRTVRNFMDSILTVLNSGIPSTTVSQTTITAYIASATAARTALTTTLSSLTAAQSALTSAQQPGASGASPDVAAGEAALKQAQGALAAARATLEKTILRTPISGTLNSFSLNLGDYVQSQSPVATIANNSALEIVAYLSQQDSVSIVVGDTVSLEGDGNGVITHIAPALDPVTKKIEVRIGVTDGASLINGQSVIVYLPHTKVTAAAQGAPLTIPITAVKVGATETDVFTVASLPDGTAGNTLVAHPVTLGELLGDRVVITNGLTPDMTIVTDARGLRAGETVEVTAGH